MILEFSKPVEETEKPLDSQEPMEEDETVFNPIFDKMVDESQDDVMITVPLD